MPAQRQTGGGGSPPIPPRSGRTPRSTGKTTRYNGSTCLALLKPFEAASSQLRAPVQRPPRRVAVLSAATLGGCAAKSQPPPAARAARACCTLGITMQLSVARGCASAARLGARQAPSRSLALPSAARPLQPSRRMRPVHAMAAEVRPPVSLEHACPRTPVLTPLASAGGLGSGEDHWRALDPAGGPEGDARRVPHQVEGQRAGLLVRLALASVARKRAFALRPYRRVVAHRRWLTAAGSRRATLPRTCCASSRRAGGPARARAS